MSTEAKAEKAPYITANYRISQIMERYGREPNINELRAIEELPLGKEKDLWDTSAHGRRIYHLLKTSEENRDVSLLDEAGQLLWEQIFRLPYPKVNEFGPSSTHKSSNVPYVDPRPQGKSTQSCHSVKSNNHGNFVLIQNSKGNQVKLVVGQEGIGPTNLRGQNEKKGISDLSSVQLSMLGCPGNAACRIASDDSTILASHPQ